ITNGHAFQDDLGALQLLLHHLGDDVVAVFLALAADAERHHRHRKDCNGTQDSLHLTLLEMNKVRKGSIYERGACSPWWDGKPSSILASSMARIRYNLRSSRASNSPARIASQPARVCSRGTCRPVCPVMDSVTNSGCVRKRSRRRARWTVSRSSTLN